MPREIDPIKTKRAEAYRLWMKAPNPMVTFFKTLDITRLIKVSKKRGLKLNMLLDYCIGREASGTEEFLLLPVGDKLIKYENIAVNTIVKKRDGGVNSCDIPYNEDVEAYNKLYLEYTSRTAENSVDIDLSGESMVIGTSAVNETELEGIVGMYSGFNNPFISWGRYKKKTFVYYLNVSLQFHHTQMDGAHAGRFLNALQYEIDKLKQ